MPILNQKCEAEYTKISDSASKNLFFLFYVFIILKHPVSCDDADKRTLVIGHGEKIMRHKLLEKLLRLRRDLDGRVAVGLQDIRDVQILAFLKACAADVNKIPEQVALAECTDVFSLLGKHGNGGITVIPHLLESLTEGVVILKCRNLTFRYKEKCRVHIKPPFR